MSIRHGLHLLHPEEDTASSKAVPYQYILDKIDSELGTQCLLSAPADIQETRGESWLSNP